MVVCGCMKRGIGVCKRYYRNRAVLELGAFGIFGLKGSQGRCDDIPLIAHTDERLRLDVALIVALALVSIHSGRGQLLIF